MTIRLFITGTDTGIGKTYVSVGLLNAFNKQKYATLGIKPIASGSIMRLGHQLQNADATALQKASSIQLPYHQINPFLFESAIAPHIAAHQEGRELDVQALKSKTQYALQYPADICLIEGVGGWYVPLNSSETMADFIKETGLKTVLVVGIRLGCINHALLTFKAMQSDHVHVAGWIANCIDPAMHVRGENIAALKEWLPIPCLGIINYKEKIEDSINVLPFINALV